MKLKLDANGNAVLKEVNGVKMPVYVHADGSESEFDAAGAASAIASRNAEAKSHREAKEAAELKLAAFKDITDPAAAIKALGVVKNLDGKTLVDASEVERRMADAAKVYTDQLDALRAEKEAVQGTLYDEMIGGAFARSKFIAEKSAIPVDFVQARFGEHFGIENGKVFAVDSQGNKILSRANPGKEADFDESLSILVDAHPQKAMFLKGTGANGGGAQGGGAAGAGGKQTYTRAQFDAMGVAERATAAREATIVD